MIENKVVDIKKFLASSSLHATPDWVQGCVEFFIAEHQNGRFTQTVLKDFVLEQWKLSDLREMGQGCLPAGLNNFTKTTLPGKYAVQVEWIKNIGQPAYSQLQNIRKQVNENTDIGANLPQTWEPRPTRMLQLMLCDGRQCVKGIEYRPLMALKEDLLPGFKLLIIGPVECRRGVLLLQQHNLKIIGGEVDSLLVPNAIENILARTLNLPVNPDPYRIQAHTSTLTEVVSQERSNQLQPVTNRNDPVQPATTSHSSGSLQSQGNLRNKRNEISNRNTEAQFFEDDDLMMGSEMDNQLSRLEDQYADEWQNSHNNEEDIDELEKQYLGELQTMGLEDMELESFNNPAVSESHQTSISANHSAPINDTSHLLDDEDDDILCQMPFDVLDTKPASPQQNTKVNLRQNERKPPANFASSRTPPLNIKTTKSQPRSMNIQSKTASQSMNVQSKITSFLNKSTELPKSSKCAENKTVHSKRELAEETKMNSYQKVVKKDSSLLPSTSRSDSSVPMGNNLSQSRLLKKTNPMTPLLSGDDFESSTFNENKNQRSSVLLKQTCRNENVRQTPVVTDSHPFVYLSQIKTPVDSCSVFTVKAFIITLLSQMTFGKEGWRLSVKLCDGSSNLDVKLSSDVLEKLIGFSAAEMRAIKQDVPKNPLLKEKLKNILKTAQLRLINLNCLLSIEFLPGTDMPCVIAMDDLTESHFHALEARLDSAYKNLA